MKILYGIYQLCIALPLIVVATVLAAAFTIGGTLLFRNEFWAYYPGKIWSKFICRILLLPVKVTGRENLKEGQSYLFVANHQGAFDIFLIYGYLGREFKWMMKKGLRKIPFVGKACEVGGQIFVDRSSPRRVLATMKKAEQTLKGGMSVVVFPEGARTFTGHMGYFKRGAFQLADALHLPVVPLTINGSFDVLPRTGRWVSWHRLELVIHEPIAPIGEGPENVKHTLEKSYRMVESAMVKEYQGMVKNDDQEVI